MPIGIIYKYTSPSNKVYIGKTINEKNRKSQHKRSANNPKSYFSYALAKYGFESFTYEVLVKTDLTLDKNKLDRVLNKLEIRYIKLFKSNEKTYGYNLTPGGDGISFTEEMKQKARENAVEKGLSKTVYQFSKDKIFIQSFPSINQAAESLKGNTSLISKRISEVCNNKWESAYNYI